MFKLDLKSRKSIYEQIIDNFKELIVTGELKSGDKIPSVRELSKEITVNPNTIQKAYRELENQGYIYTLLGVGAFVQDKSEIRVDEQRLKVLKARFEDSFNQLIYLGLSYDEAKEIALEIIDKKGGTKKWLKLKM